MPDEPQGADGAQEAATTTETATPDLASVMEAVNGVQRENARHMESLGERLSAFEQRLPQQEEADEQADDDPLAAILGSDAEEEVAQPGTLTLEQARSAFGSMREELRSELQQEMARDRQAAGWEALNERFPEFTDPERQREVAATIAAEAQAVADDLGADPEVLLNSPGFVERAYLAAQARTAAESEGSDEQKDVPLEAGGGGSASESEEDPAKAILEAGSGGGNAALRKVFGG